MIYFGGGGRGAQSLKAFLKKGMRLNWNFWRGSGVQTNKLKEKNTMGGGYVDVFLEPHSIVDYAEQVFNLKG